MKDLARELTGTVNEYIAKGLTTEEVCGCLDVVSFRVKQASLMPAEAESGGGSPVSKIFGSPEKPEED